MWANDDTVSASIHRAKPYIWQYTAHVIHVTFFTYIAYPTVHHSSHRIRSWLKFLCMTKTSLFFEFIRHSAHSFLLAAKSLLLGTLISEEGDRNIVVSSAGGDYSLQALSTSLHNAYRAKGLPTSMMAVRSTLWSQWVLAHLGHFNSLQPQSLLNFVLNNLKSKLDNGH